MFAPLSGQINCCNLEVSWEPQTLMKTSATENGWKKHNQDDIQVKIVPIDYRFRELMQLACRQLFSQRGS